MYICGFASSLTPPLSLESMLKLAKWYMKAENETKHILIIMFSSK